RRTALDDRARLDLQGLGLTGARLVHALLELLADLEERQALGRDRDSLARARIAPLVGFVGANLEGAKSADFDALARAQRLLHRIEHDGDDRFRLALAELEPSGKNFDQIRFRHALPIRLVASRQSSQTARRNQDPRAA